MSATATYTTTTTEVYRPVLWRRAQTPPLPLPPPRSASAAVTTTAVAEHIASSDAHAAASLLEPSLLPLDASGVATTLDPDGRRYIVTCLILGRPPSAAFLVNCGDGSLTLAQLIGRLKSILIHNRDSTIDPRASSSSAISRSPTAQATLQLFHVVDRNLNLSSPALDPANRRLSKVLEKDVDDDAARARMVTAMLGDACVWVTGDMLGVSVRDVVGRDTTDRDDLIVDFLILWNSGGRGNGGPVASRSVVSSPVPPAYADVPPLGQLVSRDSDPDDGLSDKPLGGGALFPDDQTPQSPLENTSPPTVAAHVPRDTQDASMLERAPSPSRQVISDESRRKRFLWQRIIIIAVILVIGVAILAGILFAEYKNLSSKDSPSDGGNSTSAAATSSGASSSSSFSSALTSSASQSASLTSSASTSTSPSKTSSSTSSSSSATCSSSLLDSFTAATAINNLGYPFGDDGTMTSISRAGGALTFVPTSNSYYYEDLVSDDNAKCGSPPSPINYLVFNISGAGTAKLSIRTGCEGPDHYTGEFSAGSSVATYAVDVLATLGGSTTLAADLYALSWESYVVTSSSTKWTLSAVYMVNDLSACGISAPLLT
ncbi:hypothetical protein HK405_003810 [Cladochytrium tenue]|nr:hypothetical protein HK405_003810 [Cladochytrium tenue]